MSNIESILNTFKFLSIPREILSLIVDSDILLLTSKGVLVDEICSGLGLDLDYVISTNNRWYGFDGWLEKDLVNLELEEYIKTRYQQLMERIEEYYERN